MWLMERITAYKCANCDKIFRTKRHDCKHDPEKKNCFTCANSRGFQSYNHERPAISCKAEHDWDLEDLKHKSYKLDCEDYVFVEQAEWAERQRQDFARG